MRSVFPIAIVLLGLVSGLINNASAAPEKMAAQKAVQKEARRESDGRAFVQSLLQKMTLKEKIAQLNQVTAAMAETGPGGVPKFRTMVERGEVGSLLNSFSVSANRELQKLALDHSRLKIPLLFGLDVVWGYRTMFPIPLGESASWDLERMQKSAAIAAKEAAADGIDWTFAPMVDIARDPRWGRVAEGAGEDPSFLGKVIVSFAAGL